MSKKKTILLVEDDDVVRGMLRYALTKSYEIIEAASYSEAIEQLNNHIDLAVVDYILPDDDGFDLLSAIRERYHDIPVIIMTAYTTEATLIKAIRTGATDFVKKPMSVTYLAQRISEILGETSIRVETEETTDRNEFIMDCIASYIKENYAESLSLEMLAEMAGMSIYMFSRKFKKRMGQSFVSFLNRIRVVHSAELLKNSGLSITEIASFVGYGGIVHFERVFKRAYGMTPTEYRRDIRKEA